MEALIIIGIIVLAYLALSKKLPPPIPPRDDFVPLPRILPTPPPPPILPTPSPFPPVPIVIGGTPASCGYHWDATFQLWIGPTSEHPSFTSTQKPEWDKYIPSTSPIVKHVAIS